MSAYQILVDVDAIAADPTAYTTDPQVTLGFEPKSWMVVNEHSTAIVMVSFDGVEDHGRLNPAVVAGLAWLQRGKKLWLRTTTNVGAPVNANVMAEY